MRKSIFHILFFFVCIFSYSQETFEGKITYKSGSNDWLNSSAVYYFVPGKIRKEISLIGVGETKDDSVVFAWQLYDIKNNLIFIIDPDRKLVQRILIDTTAPDDTGDTIKRITEERQIKGHACYGIETIVKDQMKFGDSVEIMISRHIGWYAKDLLAPDVLLYPHITDGMIDMQHICLLSESDMDINDGSSVLETDMIVESIEPGTVSTELFSIPVGYEVKDSKLSQLIRENEWGVKIELKDIRQEEPKVVPPPPPPPPKPTNKKIKG